MLVRKYPVLKMEDNIPSSKMKNDFSYTINDLSLDIQEIINGELKRDSVNKNNWLCHMCGYLNIDSPNFCVCGQIKNVLKSDSDSESSFEIINNENSTTNELAEEEHILETKDNMQWLCSTCGKISNNMKCCETMLHPPISDNNTCMTNYLTDTEIWECAWCSVQNESNYFRCKDCGHLRLDTTPRKSYMQIKPEERQCWQPRNWILVDTDKNSNNCDRDDSNFSLPISQEINHLHISTNILNEPNLSTQDDNSTFVATINNSKVDEEIPDNDQSIIFESTLPLDKKNNNISLNIIENEKSRLNLENPNQKPFESDSVLLENTKMSENNNEISIQKFITLDMLQNAIKGAKMLNKTNLQQKDSSMYLF